MNVELLPLEHELTEGEQLCFIHIQKTAGISAGAIVGNHFAPRTISPFYWWFSPELHEPNALTEYDLVMGHVFYDIYLKRTPKIPVMITFLREPAARTISYYEHIQRDPNSFGHEFVREMSLDAFIEDENWNGHIYDAQTLFIGWDGYDGSEISEEAFAQGVPPRDTLDTDLAQQRLQQMPFVGLTERFLDSINLITYTFGWRPVTHVQRLNVNARRQPRQSAANTQAQLAALNQRDLTLYNSARQLFEQRHSQMVRTLIARYGKACGTELRAENITPEEMYTLLNKRYEDRYAQRKTTKRSQFAIKLFEEPVGGGWHPAESAPRWRWTGPGTRAMLDIPLASNVALIIRFQVLMAAEPDILESLKLEVNGHQVPLSHFIDKDNTSVFQGFIFPTMLDNTKPFTRLSFVVNRTLQLNSDERELGVALGWLAIDGVQTQTRIELDLGKMLPQLWSGWYSPERNAESSWVWSGPEPISILCFPIDPRGDYRISFVVVNVLKSHILKHLRLHVNDCPIKLTRHRVTNGTGFMGVIKREILARGDGFSTLKFLVPHTVAPSSLDPTSSDDRLLGFALGQLSIEQYGPLCQNGCNNSAPKFRVE